MTERRFDCFSGEWRSYVTNAPEHPAAAAESGCAMCGVVSEGPGIGLRASHAEIAVLDDDDAPFLADPPPPDVADTPLTPVERAAGAFEVVVWSNDHDVILTDLSVERLARLIDVWAERFAELSARNVDYVLVLEEQLGAGRPADHPHAQIQALPEIPPRVRRSLAVARAYLQQHGRCIRCDAGAQTASSESRVVASDSRTFAFVPFAARYPYEVHVQPRRHATSLLDLSDPERMSLARLLHDVLVAYDRLFGRRAPYRLALQQAPTDDGNWLEVSHFFVEIAPSVTGPGPGRGHGADVGLARSSEWATGTYTVHVAPETAAQALRNAALS
jgi:UDPglucose--hexose-1-phosphate uridylyltransferase